MRFSSKLYMSVQALSEAGFYKKALSWTLSYGIIFSYPGWVYFNRVANAGTPSAKNPNGGIVEPKGTPAAKAPVASVQPTPPPAQPSGDGKAHRPVGPGAYDPSKTLPSRALEDIAKSCAPAAYLETHFKAGGDLIKKDLCVALKADTPKEVVVDCIYQMRLAMSGYQVNQYMIGQDAMEPSQAAGRASEDIDMGLQNILNQPPLYTKDDYNGVFKNKDKFTKVTQSFANDAKNKSPADRARCCIDLANHAQKIAQVLNQNKKIPDVFAEEYSDKAFLEEKQKCGGEEVAGDAKAPVVVTGGGHGKNPTLPIAPPPSEPEKKKDNTLLAILLGVGVAIIAAVLINKKSKKNKTKKKHKKVKKKKEPVDPGCGESGCTSSTGEGTSTGTSTEGTSTGETSTGTATGETTTGGTDTGSSTYSLDDNMLRPISTGGTGTDGTSPDDNPGRGSTTGATGGSITGSTTAGETTGSNGGATDGADTYSPGDNPGQVFGGDVRLAPKSQNSKTLIKKRPTKN